jgi:hypothetical protein
MAREVRWTTPRPVMGVSGYASDTKMQPTKLVAQVFNLCNRYEDC